MSKKKKVLMVCFGNTCRSPIAEAVFRNYIQDNNLEDEWEVDSAAIAGYHVGKGINARSVEVLRSHGIINYNHVVRVIKPEDFSYYNWILGMDYYNVDHLGRIQPQGTSAEIDLLGRYHPDGAVIMEDPYFDHDSRRFETCYQICSRSIPIFVQKHR